MLEFELQQYLLHEYPQENACCEWKEFKNLKNSFCGDEKNDVISYVSAIANMEGVHLVVGVKDKTLEIVGTDISRLTFNGQPANTQSATFKLTEQLTYLSSEGLSIEEFVTEDSGKRVWIIHIPKHLPRRPVLAHKKAWQRIEDSLVEMTNEKMSVILEEPIYIIIPQKCYLAFLRNDFLTQMPDVFSTNLFVCCKYANNGDVLLSV